MNIIEKVPECCRLCLNFDQSELICKMYDFLPGEGDRKDVKECSSFIDKDKSNMDDLKVLAEYIREDKDGLVDAAIQESVNKILHDYDRKFKIMVIGIARRKISAMVKMVDIIDILLNKLSDIDDSTVQDMTPGQVIKLLSELNTSVNNDLAFVMRLIQPDSDLKDLQVYIENKTLNINGSTPATEIKADEIMKLTGTSRDKIREAFDAILHRINVPEVEDVYKPTEEEIEDLTVI